MDQSEKSWADLRVAQIGNFEPEFSTENELHHALIQNGCGVVGIQEHDPYGWDDLIDRLRRKEFDVVIWTSTRGLADQIGFEAQYRMIDAANRANIPTIGIHLDRWWGLKREDELLRPFFACAQLFTADGGHQDEFLNAGINHEWMPPAISERWCQPGTSKPEYECDVVFVGGWDGYGHHEWKHRPELINFLGRTYGDRFKAFPKRGQPAIRGLELNDVYWSAKVVVGDSCLVPNADGTPVTHYCSDRIPETVGRGGYLLHPAVEGVTPNGVFYDPNFPLCDYWDLGDWKGLRQRIDEEIETGQWGSVEMRQFRIHKIKTAHTYTVRVNEVLTQCNEMGLL